MSVSGVLNHSWVRDYSGLSNFALQQAAWWACVLWMGWLGPSVMLLFLLVHVACTRREWRAELLLIALSALLGLFLDNTLAWLELVTYEGELLLGQSPLWLVAIWAGFGATLGHSQKSFVDAPYKAFLTGLFGGPLAYMGGEKLGRLSIEQPEGLVAIALLWVLVMLSLSAASRALVHERTQARDAAQL